jgi:hypothetical protein
LSKLASFKQTRMPLSLATIWSTVSCSSSHVWAGSGSFLYSAKTAASFCSLRLFDQWAAQRFGGSATRSGAAALLRRL